jgi:hypothetical protein
MRSVKFPVVATLLFVAPTLFSAVPANNGSIRGKVTLSGNPPKSKPLDLSKEPECVKMHASYPLFSENVLIGPGNSLRNVVVYISFGANDNPSVPSTPVVFDQQGCHYSTHVLPFRVGQEVKVSNSDPFS